MWNAVIYRTVPTRGKVKWLRCDVSQSSRDWGSNLGDQLGPAAADRSPPLAGWAWDSALLGVHLAGVTLGDKEATEFWRFFCISFQFCVFPLKTFWWWFFSAALTWFQPSLLCIGGGHRPCSSCERTHTYFLPLEAFARMQKKKKKIWGDRIHEVEVFVRASSLLG